MYTYALSTIGAELSVPSPVNDHRTAPELTSRACKVEPERKYPVEPLKAGTTDAEKVPNSAPLLAFSTVFGSTASRMYRRLPNKTGVFPPPPKHDVVCRHSVVPVGGETTWA